MLRVFPVIIGRADFIPPVKQRFGLDLCIDVVIDKINGEFIIPFQCLGKNIRW